jgi:hypothetical protein
VRRLAPLATLALVLAGPGCGEKPLSKSEFIARADGICQEYDKKLEALPDPKSIEDIGKLADRVVPIVDDGIGELKALKPPDSLKDQVDRWIQLNEQDLEDFENLRDAAKKGDVARTQTLAGEITRHEHETDAAARKIGLSECGNSATAGSG